MNSNLNMTSFPGGDLIFGDCIKVMQRIKDNSINMIFADPPYFLSRGGISCSSGKKVCVNKGDWDTETNGSKIVEFTKSWITECKRILKPNGTIWISGTFHNIFEIGIILKELDFKILNMVTWVKQDPPPNLSGRMFTHSSEFIIWAKNDSSSKQTFNLSIMTNLNNGKQMTDVWRLPHVTLKEKEFGYHPTQKPILLLERIILSSTNENDLVLDPFLGSGTTAVVALRNRRRFIGIENNKSFFEISCKRINYFSKVSK